MLVPHLRISGGMRIILNYASLLGKRGHEVNVYVKSRNVLRRNIANALGLGRPDWIKDFRARVKRVPDFSAGSISDGDIVVATTIQIAEQLDKLTASKGAKYFFIQHKEGLYHGSRELEAKTFSASTRKIVVSSWLKEILEKEYGQASELILNPIDKTQFSPKTKQADSRGLLRILIMHHTYEWKGVAEGYQILEELKSRHPQIRIVMFGARSKVIGYRADEYHFQPRQQELADIYSGCDIFLCPSWDEGFGLPSLEAMACGCAVVTYDNGGSRDYAFDGRTALVARRKDATDLKDKLEALVRDGVLRKRISAGGLELIKTWPTWEEQSEKLEKIFINCINKDLSTR